MLYLACSTVTDVNDDVNAGLFEVEDSALDFDINGQLIQGGGDICGAIDLDGATINVIEVEVEVAANIPDNCNSSNGSISLSPSDYTYNWNDGATGAERTGLSAGTYTVVIGDSVFPILNPSARNPSWGRFETCHICLRFASPFST